jgi:hypothetical protein
LTSPGSQNTRRPAAASEPVSSGAFAANQEWRSVDALAASHHLHAPPVRPRRKSAAPSCVGSGRVGRPDT